MSRLINFFRYHLYMSVVEFILLPFPNIKQTNILRGKLYKHLFRSCGTNLQIARNVIINVPKNIDVGNNVYFAHNCWINGAGGLIVENDVVVSPNVVIATTKHEYINQKISNTEFQSKPIIIGEGTWIAGNSTIILGLKVGRGNIIAAGSVVTKDTKDFSLYAGVPAKRIKGLS